MEESVLLVNMTFLLLVGAICSLVFKKLRMPPIIGYLATGIILANYWNDMSSDTEDIVTFLADLGLVLLMFCIGMELNLKKLRRTGGFAILVVLVQVPVMMMGGYLFGILIGWSALQAIFFGAVISGSSTAVITAVLKEQKDLSREEVETLILITVVEDVAQVVILAMATPLLVGESMDVTAIASLFAMIIIFMVASILIGLLFIPKVLDWIGNKMPTEILLITALGACFAMAYLSVLIGMSMAIGAFIMGVIVSQSKMRRNIEKDVTPMKDIFMAMFFISIGLKISPGMLLDNLPLIIVIVLIYAVLKFSSIILAFFLGDRPLRSTFISACSLIAMGEFSFIIAKEALDAGVVDESFYSSVIGAALITMIILPFLSRSANSLCTKLAEKLPPKVMAGVNKATNIRSDYYAKMSLASKTTRDLFRRRVALAYVVLMLIAVLETLFFVYNNDITSFVSEFLNISIGASYSMVLFLNFMVLLYPLYFVVTNVKFLEKVIIEMERRAASKIISEDKEKKERKYVTFFKSFVKINDWVLVFLIDFFLLMIVPNNVDFIGHFLVALSGFAILLAYYVLKYWKKII